MDSSSYISSLGALIANLHSFEMALRGYLALRFDGDALAPTQEWDTLEVGDFVTETPFTDFSSLGTLIASYNAIAPAGHQVDPSIVDLRDALAHGRFFNPSATFPLRLLKFARPVGGRAQVTWAATVDDAWLSLQRQRVFDALASVAKPQA